MKDTKNVKKSNVQAHTETAAIGAGGAGALAASSIGKSSKKKAIEAAEAAAHHASSAKRSGLKTILRSAMIPLGGGVDGAVSQAAKTGIHTAMASRLKKSSKRHARIVSISKGATKAGIGIAAGAAIAKAYRLAKERKKKESSK
jgi:hypothetical protein